MAVSEATGFLYRELETVSPTVKPISTNHAFSFNKTGDYVHLPYNDIITLLQLQKQKQKKTKITSSTNNLQKLFFFSTTTANYKTYNNHGFMNLFYRNVLKITSTQPIIFIIIFSIAAIASTQL